MWICSVLPRNLKSFGHNAKGFALYLASFTVNFEDLRLYFASFTLNLKVFALYFQNLHLYLASFAADFAGYAAYLECIALRIEDLGPHWNRVSTGSDSDRVDSRNSIDVGAPKHLRPAAGSLHHDFAGGAGRDVLPILVLLIIRL